MRHARTSGLLAAPMAMLFSLCVGQATLAAPPVAEPTAPAAPVPGNPYRGDPAAIEPGHQAYNTHCASCHGMNASQPTPDAPDLRRLNSFCNRLREPALKTHCLSDVDTHFLNSVHEGKVRAGVRYMPAWKGVLSDQTVWRIRSFIESQPPDPPRVRTSVERAAGQR